MRQHAKTLKCHEVISGTWKVWGGEQAHDVTNKDGEYLCDCDNSKRNNICSHIIAVRMAQGNYPIRGRYP